MNSGPTDPKSPFFFPNFSSEQKKVGLERGEMTFPLWLPPLACPLQTAAVEASVLVRKGDKEAVELTIPK